MLVNAPYTPAQVNLLKKWQANAEVHPFTCCANVTMTVSKTGFKCPECGNKQDWCHDFMLQKKSQPIQLFALAIDGELLYGRRIYTSLAKARAQIKRVRSSDSSKVKIHRCLCVEVIS